MFKLTNEEEVFARQLFDIRARMEALRVEEVTHTDRLLTILRGHQVQKAQGGEGLHVERAVVDSSEVIIVTKYGRHPHVL